MATTRIADPQGRRFTAEGTPLRMFALKRKKPRRVASALAFTVGSAKFDALAGSGGDRI